MRQVLKPLSVAAAVSIGVGVWLGKKLSDAYDKAVQLPKRA